MIPFRTHGGLSGRSTVNPSLAAVSVAMVFLLQLLTGCGGTSGTDSPGPNNMPAVDLWPADEGAPPTTTRQGCDILAGAAHPSGHFVFTLTESVLPSHAPVPRNLSERVVFAQLYETLIQVGCTGVIRPGLAESWTFTEDRTEWTFTLRQGARFWDGSRITAADVRQAWGDRLGLSVDVLDDRRLAVRFTAPETRFPLVLAHPDAAVAAWRPGWTWPVGSGPCRLRASDPAPLPDITCLPNQNHPDWPIWNSLTFRILPDTDPRDLVATEMDLTLVRGMDAVGFFDDAPGFTAVPLPWTRLYLLVCPPESNPQGAEHWIEAAAEFDAGRDMTAVSARAWPEIVFPAGGADRCPRLNNPVTDVGSAQLDWNLARKNLDHNVLVYPGEDAGAREMAHRLGAVAGRPARTAALPAAGVDFALQWQMAGAFVLPLELQYPTGCLQMATLLGKADWLQKAALERTDHPVETLAGADRMDALPQRTPAEILIQRNMVRSLGLSRSWLVVHGSLAGLELTFDGIPLLAGLGSSVEVSPDEATP